MPPTTSFRSTLQKGAVKTCFKTRDTLAKELHAVKENNRKEIENRAMKINLTKFYYFFDSKRGQDITSLLQKILLLQQQKKKLFSSVPASTELTKCVKVLPPKRHPIISYIQEGILVSGHNTVTLLSKFVRIQTCKI